MLIPPKYFLTSKITQLLQSIEGSKEVIKAINIPPEVEINIRKKSTLKSSLFSARIEGNPLTLEKLHQAPSKDKRRKEVFNILRALNWVREHGSRDLSTKNILTLHQIVMKDLIDKRGLGKFRTAVSKQIPSLINRLLKFINSEKEPLVPIRACLAHYSFEKIHPFLDGNGRVGRLILQAVLKKSGYGMRGLLAVEEYLDQHRIKYYRVLEEPEKDITAFLEFMLTGIGQNKKDRRL